MERDVEDRDRVGGMIQFRSFYGISNFTGNYKMASFKCKEGHSRNDKQNEPCEEKRSLSLPEVNEMTVREIRENFPASVGGTSSMMVLTLRFSDSINTLVAEYICKQAVQSIPSGQRRSNLYNLNIQRGLFYAQIASIYFPVYICINNCS